MKVTNPISFILFDLLHVLSGKSWQVLERVVSQTVVGPDRLELVVALEYVAIASGERVFYSNMLLILALA